MSLSKIEYSDKFKTVIFTYSYFSLIKLVSYKQNLKLQKFSKKFYTSQENKFYLAQEMVKISA